MLVARDGKEDKWLHNFSRDRIIAFRLPPNGNLYTAFTMDAFVQYTCGWIGVAHNCYILHARSLDRVYKKFDLQKSMNVIDESSEDISIAVGYKKIASGGWIFTKIPTVLCIPLKLQPRAPLFSQNFNFY